MESDRAVDPEARFARDMVEEFAPKIVLEKTVCSDERNSYKVTQRHAKMDITRSRRVALNAIVQSNAAYAFVLILCTFMKSHGKVKLAHACSYPHINSSDKKNQGCKQIRLL